MALSLKIKTKQKIFDFELHPNDKGKGEGQKRIFKGGTYPLLRNVTPRVILDIGANIGATSIFFSVSYPMAKIFSFEPSKSNFNVLARNVKDFPNINALNKGAFNRNVEKKIFIDDGGGGKNSIHENWTNSKSFEVVTFIDIRKFILKEKLCKIDILKVDTEGCEVKILKAILNYIPDIEVIYLEYHSRKDREIILSMLLASHDLINESFLNIPVSSSLLVGKVLKEDLNRDNRTIIVAGTVLEDRHRQQLSEMGLKTIATLCDDLGEFTFRKKSSSA